MTIFNALHRSARLSLVLLAMVVAGGVAAAPAMAEFGLQRFAVAATNENGTPDRQAGSHPYALTSTFLLNLPTQGSDIKDVKLELPPGFVGDPNAVPRCSYQRFVNQACPNETAVGISTVYITTTRQEEEGDQLDAATSAVYNLVAPTGVAAEFGFIVAQKTPVFLDTSVRTGTDYGLTTTLPNISQAVL